MAIARKCDRCGAHYDLVKGRPFSIMIFNYDEIANNKTFDLCPDCMAELRNWIDEKKGKDNERQI